MSRHFSRSDRAGLYTTVIVHLVVLIILLGTSLGAELSREESFVLDFTGLEEMEKLEQEIAEKQKELEMAQAINNRINEMLSQAGSVPVRNITVDRSILKDDRHSAEDAEKLYEDARKLEQELRHGYDLPDEDFTASTASEKPKKEPERAAYSGPSVLSYELAGRKASHLPIPAYRCMGAGQVRVEIEVNKQGVVVGATINKGESSADGCLQAFAIRAARLSKFSMSADAPVKQSGYIVYQFIAQ